MTDRTVSVRLQAQVSSYMASLSAAGKATTDLADKVDKAKGRQKAAFQTLGRGAVVAGGLVVAGFFEAERQMASFESRMALVATLSHASAAEMRQLHVAALTVGQAYGFTANQVADAEAELIKAGISVKDIMGGALTGALTLAAAGQTDVAAATETAAIAMTQFKLTGKDVPHIADLLAAGADKALGSVADLSEGLQSGGLSAAQMGLSIDDTVATLAEFAQAGLLGEKGGTVLRQMFIKLSAPSKEAADTLKQLGVNVFDAGGRFVGMSNLAGQLHDKLGKLTQAQRGHALAVIFGARAIQGANILVADGAAGWNKWAKGISDSGFAALQAAGKMNSLSGDVTKLKSALQVAFIGAGETGNGPLRSLAQDATGVIDVWNGLPGPLKSGAEALTLAGGAATLAGGAALLAIPKWSAMNAALAETSIGAVTVRGALLGLTRVTVAAGVLYGIGEAAGALDKALQPAAPSVDRLTSSLLDLGASGRASGELTKAFGKNLNTFAAELHKVADPTVGDKFVGSFLVRHNPFQALSDYVHGTHNDVEEARTDFNRLDAALAGMVTSGHADAAARAYSELVVRAKAAGISTTQLARAFPSYAAALDSSATSAKEAATGVDKYGNAVSKAAADTNKATTAAKNYNDTLHAMADPVFALSQALADLHDKQKAARDAVSGSTSVEAIAAKRALDAAQIAYHRATHGKHPNRDTVAAARNRLDNAQTAFTSAAGAHGPGSAAAKQANLDLAQSALAVTDAATALSGALRDGTTSAADMRAELASWVKQGVITQAEAASISASVRDIIRQGRTLDGLNPRLHITADISDAEGKLKVLSRTLTMLPGGNVALHTVTAGGARTGTASLGLGEATPRYAASAPRVIVVEKNSNYTTNNTTNMPNARFDDARAFTEFQRRQRRSKATL